MNRTLDIAGAAVLTLAAAATAEAEEHSVVVTGFSYVPTAVYAQPGDTIRFANQSGAEQTVVGKDPGWLVDPLQDTEKGFPTVDQETELAFCAAYQEAAEGDQAVDAEADDPEAEYGSYENAPIKAEITLGAPPPKG